MSGYYTPPPGTGGGGIGGFPKVVAVSNLVAQNTTQTIQLLPDTLPTGDYVLNDYLGPTGEDYGDLRYSVTYADENGPQEQGGSPIGNGGANPTSVAGVMLSANVLAPSTIHAVTGTPIEAVFTVTPSSVLTATVTAGNAGLLYAPGDIGTIVNGTTFPSYLVLTVGAGGAVETISITDSGSGCTISGANSTNVLSGDGDGTLKLDITALTTDVSFNYHATLVRNQ